MPTDRRALKPGDRCRVGEADIEGVVLAVTPDAISINTETEIYRLPPILVDWLPPADEPDLPIGAAVRDADNPDDDMRWWYLPASDSDSPFINVVKVGEDKFYRRYFSRDQLPARIEIVEATRADT